MFEAKHGTKGTATPDPATATGRGGLMYRAGRGDRAAREALQQHHRTADYDDPQAAPPAGWDE